MSVKRKIPAEQRRARDAVAGAMLMVQSALEDIERGDRIDAIDFIHLARKKLDAAWHIIRKSLEASYARFA